MTLLVRGFARACYRSSPCLNFLPTRTNTSIPSRTLTSLIAKTDAAETTGDIKKSGEGDKDNTKCREGLTSDLIRRVNHQIEERSHGRLFAVVQICGKQFKVTNEDLVVLEGYWPPSVGDKLRLNKVLLVGGTDFTIIGRPLLSPNLVYVEGTIIEKNMSHTRTHFRKRKRKQYQRINFYKSEQTTVRINKIELMGEVNNRRNVGELEDRLF